MSVMKIQVLFFAGAREAVGLAEESIEIPDHVKNLGQLRDWYVARGEPWASALAATSAIRAALNHAVCDWDAQLTPNAEVAFFPPVTGG